MRRIPPRSRLRASPTSGTTRTASSLASAGSAGTAARGGAGRPARRGAAAAGAADTAGAPTSCFSAEVAAGTTGGSAGRPETAGGSAGAAADGAGPGRAPSSERPPVRNPKPVAIPTATRARPRSATPAKASRFEDQTSRAERPPRFAPVVEASAAGWITTLAAVDTESSATPAGADTLSGAGATAGTGGGSTRGRERHAGRRRTLPRRIRREAGDQRTADRPLRRGGPRGNRVARSRRRRRRFGVGFEGQAVAADSATVPESSTMRWIRWSQTQVPLALFRSRRM